MKEDNSNKVKDIIKDRQHAHKFFSKNSKVYNAFLEMEKTTYAGGELEKKYKELIAIGISICINCESCMEWHIKEALRAGATQKQIIEAIEVGFEMGGGPATVSGRFALKVLEYYSDKK